MKFSSFLIFFFLANGANKKWNDPVISCGLMSLCCGWLYSSPWTILSKRDCYALSLPRFTFFSVLEYIYAHTKSESDVYEILLLLAGWCASLRRCRTCILRDTLISRPTAVSFNFISSFFPSYYTDMLPSLPGSGSLRSIQNPHPRVLPLFPRSRAGI